MAEKELPAGVKRDAGMGVQGTHDFFGGIGAVVDDLVIGDKKEEGVVRQFFHPALRLGQINLHPVIDLQPVFIARDESLNLLLDRPSGGRVVADNHHAALFPVQFQGDIDGPEQIKAFDDTGEISCRQLFIPQVIDAAKDDRHPREELRAGFQGKIEGIVIRDDNDIEMLAGVFFLENL